MSFYLIRGAVYIRRNRLDNLNRYLAFMIRIKKHPKDLTNFVRGRLSENSDSYRMKKG